MSNVDAMNWMFKNEFGFERMPEPPDWDVFMKSILLCAGADGKLDPAERQWVVGFAAAHGAPDPFVEALRVWKPEGGLKERMESRETSSKSRRSLIYFAIQACSADGEYHASERAAVQKVADELGVGDAVGQIESFVQEETAMRERRKALLFNEGSPF